MSNLKTNESNVTFDSGYLHLTGEQKVLLLELIGGILNNAVPDIETFKKCVTVIKIDMDGWFHLNQCFTKIMETQKTK